MMIVIMLTCTRLYEIRHILRGFAREEIKTLCNECGVLLAARAVLSTG